MQVDSTNSPSGIVDRARWGLGGKMLIQQAPAAGNGSGGDGGKEERFETPNERVRREIRKQFPGVFEYTHGSGFEDWD